MNVSVQTPSPAVCVAVGAVVEHRLHDLCAAAADEAIEIRQLQRDVAGGLGVRLDRDGLRRERVGPHRIRRGFDVLQA